MKRIIYFLIFLIFVFYWASTVLFTMPNNFIKLSLDKSNRLFESLFYQQWSFFAPPPKYNEYMYYIFIDKATNSQKAFEVLKTINIRKQKDAPFNWKSEGIDYILSSSVMGIMDDVREKNNYFQYQQNENHPRNDFADSQLIKSVEENYMFLTIKNYGKIVAKNNNIDLNKNFMLVRITTKNIPQFTDRNKNIQMPEELYFQSNPIIF